ncbi:helix-turn-helix domain-containing protein [Legionella parisiensis]|uniref:Winged helix-turn-helix domain-containing protein n=1 Tax=Legionella parisiensis TaxID=45071 RepID=A0A1E5JPD1_9GAMM|nr:helix-turn-helix domain-containing protein [Legionella parisiensis]KTD41851.1 hypothetical protein Lpar_3168 [Legionella parisiensis]OEH46213.1 hypothetical protein lpari_02551 [Legionella parisiensis]STX75822.1 Uncharacterised protein [Legionella parisiensis]
MKKKNSPDSLGNPPKNSQGYSNLKPNQRARILKAFKINPRLSTFTLRKMGIVSPAPRIGELREFHEIDTEWTDEADENGVMHHIALYVYYGKKSDLEGN